MKDGFSLVELSIVLVILGLLTGGILAGQSLIHAAELRAVPSEYQRYITAMHAFRDKYFGWPGDITNATDIWGAADSNSATCWTTDSTGSTATCNGNADGDIGNAAANPAERFRAWQQLANAGLIEGSYSGVSGPNSAYKDSVIGTNVPRSKYPNAGWTARYLRDSDTLPSGNSTIFALSYGNVLDFGAESGADSTNGKLMKPEDLWNIDTKMDDGKPGTGRLIAGFWDSCTDAASATSTASASYDLTVTTGECSAYFRNITQ